MTNAVLESCRQELKTLSDKSWLKHEKLLFIVIAIAFIHAQNSQALKFSARRRFYMTWTPLIKKYKCRARELAVRLWNETRTPSSSMSRIFSPSSSEWIAFKKLITSKSRFWHLCRFLIICKMSNVPWNLELKISFVIHHKSVPTSRPLWTLPSHIIYRIIYCCAARILRCLAGKELQ